GGYALYMGDGDGSTIGGIDPAARNVISGNDSMAIYIGGDGNTVQGNLIGTDATGAFALGNSEGGIRIEGTGNTVGGVTAAERNVISANGIGSSNHRYGIEIKSPGSGNMVKGNYIGTDITGTVGMGNYNGIALDASPGNIVGGSETGAGNVISGGQRVGLGIWWSGASGNIIKGNLIGTDATGTQPLGNLEEAIRIYGAPDNTIGGTEPGAGNVLAYTTGGSGITVQAGAATGNEILGNSIHSNYDIGIELGFWDGVTANDSLDLDTGPNGLQNFPVLTSVLSAGALVEGSLHSAPLTTFRIELFSNTECDPAGYGEGETYLGYESVTTDASGDAVFMATLDQPAETGTYLTATATSTTGNTSEFGECLPVVDSPALFEYAVIDSIVDVPGDQGGWARIYFRRSIYDYALETEIPITGYDMHRRVEDPALIAAILAKATEKEDEPARKVEHDGIFYKVNGDVSPEPPGLWEVVGSISARQRDQYIGLVPTLGDSAATIPWTVYYIAAYTTTPSVFFDSPADSGYSVDNIAPGVPLGMSIAYNTGSGNELAWDPSPEPDFQYYRVYRGDDEGFVPGPGSLVHETASPAWTDPDYDGWDVHYKVTALDHAGNESEAATAASVTGDDVPGVPEAYAL
ncbi:MAG TPA: hypothetical protein VLA34_01535, partial [Candidatus Krumholzibacterium sp.]|nr:hypothetical protein [Candidatus Krumholzibacterium sp.]